MKYLAVCWFAVVLCYGVACKSNKAAYKNVVKHDSLLLYEVPVDAEKITKVYTGDFKGSPISIELDYIAGKRVCGHNIHKGLRRNMSGSIMLDGGRLHLVMQEPGTNEYDGVFDMWLDTATKKMQGTWKAFSGNERSGTLFNLSEGRNDYFAHFYDTTGVDLLMNQNGSCVYSYLVNDSTDAAQQLSFSGSYKLSSDSSLITFFWQPNEVFPSRKSVFSVTKNTASDDEPTELMTLTGEGKVLHETYD